MFLHWSWFLVAVYEINSQSRRYSSIAFNILEYLSLFLIVLLHEFGHALACRQVGGTANQIVLWPLGGVAYVNPPPRPGAALESRGRTAGECGPYSSYPAAYKSFRFGLGMASPDLVALLEAIFFINAALLVFNMLPIYPLDGGQILRALLWFLMGRARSLMVATVVGFVGVAGLIVVAVRIGSLWFGVLSVFILLNCWGGLRHALALSRLVKLPRRDGFACPKCKTPPPAGELWKCRQCGRPFDTFQSGAVCPYCAAQFPVTACLECGAVSPMSEWVASAFAAPAR